MKKKPFNPLILGAILLGLLSFWLVTNELKKIDNQRRIDIEAAVKQVRDELASKTVTTSAPVVLMKENKRPVVYARTSIRPGDKVESTMLETKDTPENLLLAAYTKPEEVVGQYATAAIEVGEPLMPSNVSKQVQRMSVKLTPGMRAVTLPIDGVRNVTGRFVTDGDLVDVLLTYSTGGKLANGQEVSQTKIVLQNVKVLYAPGPDDYRTEQTRPLKVRPEGDMVTFEVTPEDAEMLVQMNGMGTYRLILRNRDDRLERKTKGFTTADFYDDDNAAQRRSTRSAQSAQEILKELKQVKPEQNSGGAVPNAN
jgi:Flp pilus assembly protein CpaB